MCLEISEEIFPVFLRACRAASSLEIFPVFLRACRAARGRAALPALPCGQGKHSADFFENVLLNLLVFLRCSTQFRHFLEAEAACGLGLGLPGLASQASQIFRRQFDDFLRQFDGEIHLFNSPKIFVKIDRVF